MAQQLRRYAVSIVRSGSKLTGHGVMAESPIRAARRVSVEYQLEPGIALEVESDAPQAGPHGPVRCYEVGPRPYIVQTRGFATSNAGVRVS